MCPYNPREISPICVSQWKENIVACCLHDNAWNMILTPGQKQNPAAHNVNMGIEPKSFNCF